MHAAAWKRVFDEFLKKRSGDLGEPFVPFDINTDYRSYVDGKPRYDGVAGFLKARGIKLPQEMERLDMRIRYRGHSLDLRLTRDTLTVRGRDRAAAPILLGVEGKVWEFAGGTTRVFPLHDEGAK